MVVAQGFDVLTAQTSTYVRQAAELFKTNNQAHRDKPTLYTDNIAIYLKPSTNSNQAQYICLENTTHMERIHAAWTNASIRSGGQASFKLELFVYCQKKKNSGQTTMRATHARIDDARQNVRIPRLS